MNKIITHKRKLSRLSEIKKHIRVCCGLLLLLMTGPLLAQVQIGVQDGTTSNIPIHGLYNYSHSQQIVYQSEIDASGDINSISFYYASAGTTTSNNDWNIYLGHTAKTNFADDTDWISAATLTPVFSGIVTFPAAGNLMLITFDSPFSYNNTDNLVVAVTENQSGWSSMSFGKTTTVANTNRSIYWSSDASMADINAPASAKSRFNYINNMILGGIQQSCPGPSDLIVSGITQTSALIGWNEIGSATQWEVLYGPMGFDPQSGGTSNSTTTNPALLNGLVNSTTYDFYVKSICGSSEESPWTGPYGFTTACGAATVPYLLDFETAVVPSLPSCTSRETFGIGKDWRTATSASGFTGKVLNYPYHPSTPVGTADSWFYTQGVELEAGTYYDISYKYGNNSTTFTESMRVTYGTSPDQAAMTTELADYPIIKFPSGASVDELLTFMVPANGIYYFGFNSYSIQNQNQLYVDDISIVVSPSCPAPSQLAAYNVNEDSADIVWTESTSASDWEMVYGLSGFDHLEDGTVEYVEFYPMVTLENLTPNTSYDFYVRAICDLYDESTWAGPETFKTACAPVTELTENFDSYGTGNIVPDCWDRMVPETSPGNQTISSTSPSSGTRNMYQYASSSQNAIIVALPELSNVRAGTHWLRFRARVSSGAPGTLSVGYVTDVNDYSSFTTIEDLSITNTSYTADEAVYTVAIPTSVPINARIAIKNANDGKSYYWDDVNYEVSPTCLAPKSFHGTITSNSVDVSWSAGGSETSWNVSWGTPGYTPGDAGEIDSGISTSTSYQITGLTANTDYDVYVQADCGEGDVSTWVGLQVYTGYCIATTTGATAHINSFTATGDLGQDIQNNGSGPSLNGSGYSDYTSLPALMTTPQSQVDFTTVISSGTTGLRIWVDWDRNLMFGDDVSGEEVYRSSGYLSTHSGSFVVPANATGTYRMRVGASYIPSDGPENPCSLSSSGEYEDYLIEVTSLEACTGANAGIPDEAAIELCAGTEFSISVTGASAPADGLVRTWQSSSAGANTWTSIDDATSSIYLVSEGVLEATDFRYVVTCTPTGISDESEVIEISLAPYQGCICLPNITVTVEPITHVSFANINNTTDAASLDEYEDFTTQSTPLSLGETYEITLEGNTAGTYNNYFTVFIDWNQNEILDDAGEMYQIGSIYNSTGTDGISVSGDIEVPADAAIGNTRMRIIKQFNTSPTNPCGSYSFGQTEDYTVVVMEGAANGSLDGTVDWNSNCGDRDATVKLYEPGTATQVASYDVSIQADGSFNISNLEIGTFDVIVKVAGYLAKGIQNVEITSGTNSIAVGAILFGDINNNNVVNFSDFGLLSGAYLTQVNIDPGYIPMADYNCDGVINFTDFGVFSGTYLLVGAIAPLVSP